MSFEILAFLSKQVSKTSLFFTSPRYSEVLPVDIPYDDNCFDVVVANYMLYHVPNRGKAIAEIRRVLKPDGVLFAATNGEKHMRQLYVLAQVIDENELWASPLKESFSLNNGLGQLMEQFKDIRMLRFDNNLFVTEAQPIIDYIASMMSIDGVGILEKKETEIRENINRLIADKGGILIEKETGIFIARGTYAQHS